MSLTSHAVADQLAIPSQKLWRQALQAFLREQARFYNIERLHIMDARLRVLITDGSYLDFW